MKSYDLQILRKVNNHLGKALDILWDADMENESAVRLRDELVAYLNPQLVVVGKVIGIVEKEEK